MREALHKGMFEQSATRMQESALALRREPFQFYKGDRRVWITRPNVKMVV
ncbi:hypothetical protein KSD_63320 [Ktedonobacter sp. SOSP1-85]|nr:hypothetical protein KSD_63320 [Ktedonobacter sp. SOSP1-85]